MAFDLNDYLEQYRDILAQYPHINVRLISSHRDPYNLSIASARTCYSSKGIMLPEDMEKNPQLRDAIAESTMQAGHLTTRQHAHFILGIEGISRNIIWQFLHSHPFYNSEQVSQRYVPIKGKNWFSLPVSLRSKDILDFHEDTINTYHKLINELTPYVEEEFFSIYRSRKNAREKFAKHIEKKAMEIARYVIPLSTTAYLYHTISVLTLYRYVRMMKSFDSDEAIALVLKILIEVQKESPDIVREIPEPMNEEKKGYDPLEAGKLNRLFDEKLKMFSTKSRLASGPENLESLIQEIGISAGLSKNHTVDSILSTDENPSLMDTLYPVTLDYKSRVLNQIHFTFQKKLSHSADSQEQRHRMLPGSRPLLASQVSLGPDFITPFLIKHIGGKVQSLYENQMDKNFKIIKEKHNKGVSLPDLTYLLPNSFPVRFYESGDLLNFFHKWKARLCYTSQEEIFYSTLDEVKQVIMKYPFMENYIGAPCTLRVNTRPICPEGDKYCGVKVWKLSLDQYKRLI